MEKPRTADGYPIKPLMIVWDVRTCDGGESWYTEKSQVSSVDGMLVKLVGKKFMIHVGAGDNRLYHRMKNAKIGARSRELQHKTSSAGLSFRPSEL